MHVVDLSGNEYMLQATYTIEGELNANQSISVKILSTKVNKAFIENIAEMWSIVDNSNVEYKVVYCKKKGEGKLMTVDIKGIPLFFDTLDNDRIYERHDSHMTANQAFTLIFKDTGFTFALVDAFQAVQWEGFGEGETKLETFKRALNRYGAEFRISGSTVYLERQTGRDLSVMYRHRLNASNIIQENDAEEYWTYMRGYGDYDDGEDGGWQTAKIKREYTSPLAKILGKKHAPPLKDGRRTDSDELYNVLKETVDNSLKISVTADIHDLRNQGYPIARTQLGDRVFIIDERIGLNDEVRIVNQTITKDWRGNVVDIKLTFGTESLVKRHQSNMQTAVKNINDIITGRKQVPLSALDQRVKEISEIINGNNNSVFKYTPNGVVGWNGDDPNYMTRYVGDAIGFSRDGGKTYGTAMSAELGIVADYVTTGTLDANLVRVVGGNDTTYTFIEGDYIESRGQYYRTWFGETSYADLKFQLGRGYFRVNNEAENKRLYFSDKGISTFIQGYADENPDQENSGSGVIEFFSHQYNGPQWNTGNIRGLTIFSNQGHVAIKTANRDIILDADRDVKILASRGTVTLQPRDGNRDGLNHFRFNVKDNDSAGLSDGWIQYGSPSANYGSGLRFKKSTSGRPIIYATNGNGDINSGNVQADAFIGSLEAPSDNAYALVNDRLRITSKAGYNNGSPNYRDLQAAEGSFRSIKLNTDMSGSNFYIGVSSGELRVTSNLLGDGGSYRPIRIREVILDGGGRLVHEDGSTFIQGNVDVRATRVRSGTLVPMVAREFNSSSSEELKTNIKPYEGNGLDVVCGLNIVNFDWIESPEAGRQIGVIAENSPDISSSSGKEIKINDLVMYLTKSVQELHEENNKLRGEIEHGKQSHKFNRQLFGRSSSRQSPTNRRIRNSFSRDAS